MILENTVQSEVLGIDPSSTIDMTISEDDKAILMMLLSSNLYTDAIGSLIREIFSNAKDSNMSAGINEPIKLRLVKENESYFFSIEDNGLGMSPQLIEDVYSKYCASTKRQDAKAIGAFGIGKLAPLSYTDSFLISSIYDNKCYEYMMFKGQEGTQISLLDINEVIAHNGVIIKIPLKEDNDYEAFVKKIKEQLCYAEMVSFETEYDDITNDHKIIIGDGWKYSELSQDSYLHLSLDNIYYPCPFDKLGIDPIKIPVALTFTLTDKITPTPNRENLIINNYTKELILTRIKKVCKEFIEKYNSSLVAVNDITTAHSLHTNLGKITLYKEEVNGQILKNIEVKIPKSIEKLAGIEMKSVALTLYPNLNTEKLHANLAFLFQEYKVFGRYEGSNYVTKFGNKNSRREYDNLSYGSLYRYGNIYLLKTGETLTKQQIDYLKWKNETFNIIRQHSTTKLGKYNHNNYYSLECYRGLLELHKYSKENWRTIIKDYQAFLKSYTDKFLSINDIVPTQEYLDWKETQRAVRKTSKRNTKEQISFFTFRKPLNGRAKNKYICDDVTTIFTKDLSKQKGIFVYTTEDDDTVSDEMFDFFNSKMNNAKIVMLSDQNYKKIAKLKPLHNWIKISDFWKTKNRQVSEILTRHLLELVEEELEAPVLNEHTGVLDKKAAVEYKNIASYPSSINLYNWENWVDDKIQLYARKGWLNTVKINEFKKVFADIHRFDFLDMFNFDYYRDIKLIKSFALTVYLKLCKEEKTTGKFSYERYNMDEIFSKYLRESVEDVDIQTAIDPIENEEPLVTSELPEEELILEEAF